MPYKKLDLVTLKGDTDPYIIEDVLFGNRYMILNQTWGTKKEVSEGELKPALYKEGDYVQWFGDVDDDGKLIGKVDNNKKWIGRAWTIHKIFTDDKGKVRYDLIIDDPKEYKPELALGRTKDEFEPAKVVLS